MLAFRIIKDTFIKFYDKLFQLVILNLVLITVIALPLYLLYLLNNVVVLALSLVYIVLFIGPMILSALNYINDTLDYTKDVKIKDFFRGIKENYKRGEIAFLFTVIIYAILLIDLFFFWTRAEGFLMSFVAIIFLYLVICFTFMQVYFWGLLSLQKEKSIKLIIKNSFLMAIDNIFSTFFILVFVFIFTLLCLVLPVMVPFFIFSTIILLVLIATDYTLEKYRHKENNDSKGKEDNQ
ncbi:MAG: hypothetical protein ACOCZT_01305 [Halanaerobiales bacterium]